MEDSSCRWRFVCRFRVEQNTHCVCTNCSLVYEISRQLFSLWRGYDIGFVEVDFCARRVYTTQVKITNTSRGNRGVSPVIASLLVIVLVTITFTQYQSQVVPNQVASAETTHQEQVVSDLTGFHSAVTRSVSSDRLVEPEIRTGVSYGIPGVTPAPRRGTVYSEKPQNDISIHNSKNDKSASNFYTGFEAKSYETRWINYEIQYTQTPTTNDITYENGILYKNVSRATNTQATNRYNILSKTSIVNGRSIRLYALAGNLSISKSGETTLRVNAVNAPSRPISVQQNSTNPIQVRIPTKIPKRVWETDILASELESNGGYVRGFETFPDKNVIGINMSTGQEYKLQLGRAFVSAKSRQTKPPEQEFQYVSRRETQSANLRGGQSNEITAEARDRYNNPVPGITVYAEVALESGTNQANEECIGDFVIEANPAPRCNNNRDASQPGRAVSNEAGEVSYIYDAPDSRDPSSDVNISVYRP